MTASFSATARATNALTLLEYDNMFFYGRSASVTRERRFGIDSNTTEMFLCEAVTMLHYNALSRLQTHAPALSFHIIIVHLANKFVHIMFSFMP